MYVLVKDVKLKSPNIFREFSLIKMWIQIKKDTGKKVERNRITEQEDLSSRSVLQRHHDSLAVRGKARKAKKYCNTGFVSG